MPRGIFKNGNKGLFKKGNLKSLKAFAFQIGHKTSSETKKKIGDAQRGEKSHNWGKHISEEQRKRQSKISKGKGIKPPVMYGKNNPSWKGGVTSTNDKIRKSLEMLLFKKACMERDNFTCQKTGQKGGRLEVHHINNFADFPELRTSIENGISLSRESHIEFHKIYGKKNNSREQLEEFLNIK